MDDLRPLVWTFSAANFVIGMGAFVVVGLVEPIAADFGISDVAAGQLMTLYAVAYALASPVLVSVTGSLGRRRVMFWALATFALAAALSAVAWTHGMLMGARVLAALGAGLMTPVAAAVIAALSPDASRGKTLAKVFFGLTLAQVIGVPAGAFIGYTLGWRWAFAIVAILAVPCLWLIWTRVPRGLQFQPVSLRDLGAVMRNPRMLLAVSFTATFLAGIYVVYTYFAPLLSQTMGFGGTEISLTLLIFGCGAVVGNLFGGWLTDRFGPERTLVLLTIVQCLLMPLYSVLPMPALFLYGLCLVWAIFGWSFMVAQQARLVSRNPAQAPVTLALNAAAIYVGAALGAAIGGAMLAGYGPLSLGITGSAVTALALLSLRLAR